ncbi:MAG: hypothetical protein IJV67_05305 [Clostridia bacterium]|nr:hypothetical protein [Clostridia bacterium]
MKYARIKAYGKINIGLNIKGVENGFHALETIMAEINYYDLITAKSRKDDVVNVSFTGIKNNELNGFNSNVYKTARLFAQQFKTNGVDIKVKKNIPVGSGLGGSSADIVGTVKAMAELYGIKEGLTEFVNTLCSDGEFLMRGGCALVEGRGSVVREIVPESILYMVIVTPETEFSTKDVFEEFDKDTYPSSNADLSDCISYLENGTPLNSCVAFNALFEPSCKLNPLIREAFCDVKKLSPTLAGMSGSGSSVFGIFDSLDLCLWARDKLIHKWDNACVTETIKRKNCK